LDVDELISSIDIVDFIGQYVDLEQRNEEYFGLSPFKKEKTPSFTVRPNPPLWYDFSSGKGGNVFTFAKEYFKCSSKRAIKILEDFAGVDGSALSSGNKLSATIDCKRFMKPNSTVKQSAGIVLQDDCMDKYDVDWSKTKIWENEGISQESMKKFGVRYDPFSNRLVYPIRDINGKIRNIGGRTLDPNFKEKNLRKYTYMNKWGTMDVVYALYDNMEWIEDTRIVIVFEGMKSVLKCDTWGIHNTVALLTSHLNQHQMMLLLGLNLHEIVFALDNDVDIRKDKRISTLKNIVNVSYLKDTQGLLHTKDAPVDEGLDVFSELCRHRIKYR